MCANDGISAASTVESTTQDEFDSDSSSGPITEEKQATMSVGLSRGQKLDQEIVGPQADGPDAVVHQIQTAAAPKVQGKSVQELAAIGRMKFFCARVLKSAQGSGSF